MNLTIKAPQYMVAKHKTKKMESALRACSEYVANGIPAFVIPYGKREFVVCFGRYKHGESAEQLKRELYLKYNIKNVQILKEV